MGPSKLLGPKSKVSTRSEAKRDIRSESFLIKTNHSNMCLDKQETQTSFFVSSSMNRSYLLRLVTFPIEEGIVPVML